MASVATNLADRSYQQPAVEDEVVECVRVAAEESEKQFTFVCRVLRELSRLRYPYLPFPRLPRAMSIQDRADLIINHVMDMFNELQEDEEEIEFPVAMFIQDETNSTFTPVIDDGGELADGHMAGGHYYITQYGLIGI